MATILIVDDVNSERELMSGYLEEDGYFVIQATSGKEALDKVLSQKPDLVITDLVMPDMNGLELCRAIRKNPETEKLPIIACTSKNQELDRMWGLKQGLNLYLTKPYTREEVTRSVKSLLA